MGKRAIVHTIKRLYITFSDDEVASGKIRSRHLTAPSHRPLNTENLEEFREGEMWGIAASSLLSHLEEL